MSWFRRSTDEDFPLRGQRVTLRKYRRDDVDRRCAWPKFEDPFLKENNLNLPDEMQRDRWFTTRSRARWLWFAVHNEHGQMIGDLSLTRVNWRRKSAVLGIVLSPKFVGKGYGSDAIQTLLRYYFGQLRYNSLSLEASQLNNRAIRCYEKCGFRRVGEHWKDDLSGLNIFNDDAYRDIREYFKIQRGRLKVKFFDMEVRKDERGWKRAWASRNKDDER